MVQVCWITLYDFLKFCYITLMSFLWPTWLVQLVEHGTVKAVVSGLNFTGTSKISSCHFDLGHCVGRSCVLTIAEEGVNGLFRNRLVLVGYPRMPVSWTDHLDITQEGVDSGVNSRKQHTHKSLFVSFRGEITCII